MGAQEALRGVGTGPTEPSEWKATFLPKPLCTGPTGWYLPHSPQRAQCRSRICCWPRPEACGPSGDVARGPGDEELPGGETAGGRRRPPRTRQGSRCGGFRAAPLSWVDRADNPGSRITAPGQGALWGERPSRASLRGPSVLGLRSPVRRGGGTWRGGLGEPVTAI